MNGVCLVLFNFTRFSGLVKVFCVYVFILFEASIQSHQYFSMALYNITLLVY